MSVHQQQRRRRAVVFLSLLAVVCVSTLFNASCQDRRAGQIQTPAVAPSDATAATQPVNPAMLGFAFPVAPAERRGDEELTRMNAACVACHTESDDHDMHATISGISCVDCHGGRWDLPVPPDLADNAEDYQRFKNATHVPPTLVGVWKTSANPEVAGPATLAEGKDFIRFVNPGDLRAAYAACGNCHNTPADGFIVDRVRTSMMTHGAMLWQSALYNNGAINRKIPVYGEVYSVDGEPARVIANPRVTMRQWLEDGLLPQLFPLPRWEITQPGNILRVFERGGRLRPIIGVPVPVEDPGRPDVKLSVRGVGTDVRTDPVFIGLQKTRLLDPTLNMMGTNDHPGDYRASGCSACHVVYANDRSPVHSGEWAKYGNRGESFSVDPTVNPPRAGSGPTTQPYDDPWADREHRESGHPVKHVFVKSSPTSACISCHVHPGTNVVNSYLGFLWWDNETDGQLMYPRKQRYPTADDFNVVHAHNPEGAATKGLWSNRYPGAESHAGTPARPDFLEELVKLNPQLKHTQFADFHGHGWVFRAVYKQDRKGNMLDHKGAVVQDVTADKMAKAVNYTQDSARSAEDDKAIRDGMPVHLKDIHLEKGMGCNDCHFEQDNHGDGNLYGETRAAVMVACEDCHGTVDRPANLFRYLSASSREQRADEAQGWLANAFTGPAADNGLSDDEKRKRNAEILADHFKFLRAGGERVMQVSTETGKERWRLVQTVDTTTSDSWWAEAKTEAGDKDTMAAARYAHTVRKGQRDGQFVWGGDPATDQTSDDMKLAHGNNMACYACHTSWTTSCFGCHLPQRANQRRPMLHNEGAITRNYVNYNFQTLRDDLYMLGVDGVSTAGKDANGNPVQKIVPIRSSCAVLVSSQDALRQWIYVQQQTVSAEGFAGTAFSPFFPHTVRATETKQCSDCHLSDQGDNNAVMAHILLHGSNSVNFVGRFAWVGMGKGGVEAVAVTERDEPQAVIGSRLHELAYPDFYKRHVNNGMKLELAHEHHGTVLDVQQRGEYLYAACGPDGFIAYDIANIDNKGFSERFVTAPVSPLGQRFYVNTKYATSICSPSTMAIDPTRPRRPENLEQPIHLLYAFLYLTDREEGLIVIGNPLDEKRNKPGVATLLDGDPANNFLRRALTWNPDGLLTGARHMALHGHHAYITSNAGVVVVDLNNPLKPRVVTVLSEFNGPKRVAFQFRYGFVIDNEGLKVIDVTFPDRPKVVGGASVAIPDARDIYVSRTYGYVAAGGKGLVIVDLTKPEQPAIDQTFNADGKMNDATAVKVGMTNSSLFAYVADGRNGLKVIQLTSADDTPGYMGFSPRPRPRLIAWKHTHRPALAISEGLDRDRAVDEAGNQLAVFGRRGARPFNLFEQQKLYLRTGPDGPTLYLVSDRPKNEPNEPTVKEGEGEEAEPGAEPQPGPRRPRRPGRPGGPR